MVVAPGAAYHVLCRGHELDTATPELGARVPVGAPTRGVDGAEVVVGDCTGKGQHSQGEATAIDAGAAYRDTAWGGRAVRVTQDKEKTAIRSRDCTCEGQHKEKPPLSFCFFTPEYQSLLMPFTYTGGST